MNMNYTMCSVCTGNTCRSAFAECVTKKRLADAGRSDIEVFSPGNYKEAFSHPHFAHKASRQLMQGQDKNSISQRQRKSFSKIFRNVALAG